MNGYPAAIVDVLCGQVEAAKRGKKNKSAAYAAAVYQLVQGTYRDQATFGAWSALAACAWSEGADQELLDRDRIQAERFFGVGGTVAEPGMAQRRQIQR